jgi:prepilin-type N-terminal cleavage/methylation domain-containing protein
MYQNIKKAFTLVELIVVITILAILATVAFISFQWYALIARDSARLSDLSSMEKILTLYNEKNWSYPSPDTSTNITYSWATAWTQWVFGTSAYTESSSMSEVPVDPVTGLEYTYSITANGQEYQLWSVLENTTSLNNISSLYAWTQ